MESAEQPPLLDRMLQVPRAAVGGSGSRWLASILSAPLDAELSTPEAVSNSSSGDTGRQQQSASSAAAAAAASASQSTSQAKPGSPLEQQEWSRRISAGLCPHCDAPAVTEEQRHFHERVHAMDELYRCQLCACRFAYPSSLRLHLALHGEQRDLQYRLHCTRAKPNTQHHFASPPPPKKLYLSAFLGEQQQQLEQQQQQQLEQQQQLQLGPPQPSGSCALADTGFALASYEAACPDSALHQQQQLQQMQQGVPGHQHQHQQQQQQHQHRCPHCSKSYVRLGNLRNHLQRFHPY